MVLENDYAMKALNLPDYDFTNQTYGSIVRVAPISEA